MAIAPMLSRLCTIVLLALASLRVNAASLTGVIITNEATSSPAVHFAAVDQVQTTNLGALADLRTVGGTQNQTGETQRDYEEALKTYREFAAKEPQTYLPRVAATLNNLGILDRAQNRPAEGRKAFEEALKIYEAFAKQDPDQFSPLLERVKMLLKHLPK